MMQRCYNPDRIRYESYGGRGIFVCDEWHNFWIFKDWAESNGYQDNLTIERINVNGPYEPQNCKWIRQDEQALNTRRSKLLTAFGETKSMSKWSKDPRCVVSYFSLRSRIRYGWNAEIAISKYKGATK